MPIWEIPRDKIINYSPIGDDINAFANKTKFCIEEAFTSLKYLHDAQEAVEFPIAVENLVDEQILVYDTGTSCFHNEDFSALFAVASESQANRIEALESGVASLQQASASLAGESLSSRVESLETAVGGFQLGSESLANRLAPLEDEIGRLRLASESAATKVDSFEGKTAHLQRLVANLYLALDVAGLNPGGYDGLSSNTFFGSANDVDTLRSYGEISEGKFVGEDVAFITKPISLISEITGAPIPVSHANLVVKHQNATTADISAEIALQKNAVFVKGESLGVGTGRSRTVALAHKNNISEYKYSIYFNGIRQDDSVSLLPVDGKVTFNAPAGTSVTVDYFYNWEEETFIPMAKTRTYPDHYNSNRATTQFTYDGGAGVVATLRITVGEGSGESFWIDSFACIFDE